MITFYQKYALVINRSQNGEDGILNQIFKRIGVTPEEVCEYGANDGLFCSNVLPYLLDDAHGTLIEADENLYQECIKNLEEVNVDVLCSMVTPENVNTIVPQKLDLLSIDTDGSNDYYCWKAYTGKPPVVVIEINSGYLPMEDRVEEGANYSAMVKLGIEKGYFLVVHTGNLVFCLNEYRDKFPDILGDGLSNSDLYFLKLWL